MGSPLHPVVGIVLSVGYNVHIEDV